MGRTIIKCLKCYETKQQHAKGLCYSCYKKSYRQKKIICSNCKREIERHTKDLCSGCYNTLKFKNYTRDKNLSLKYKLTTKKILELRSRGCVICGWNKKIHLHHKDQNRENNSIDNLIVLCPNHHYSLHSKDYQKETIEELQKINIITPEVIVQIKRN